MMGFEQLGHPRAEIFQKCPIDITKEDRSTVGEKITEVSLSIVDSRIETKRVAELKTSRSYREHSNIVIKISIIIIYRSTKLA